MKSSQSISSALIVIALLLPFHHLLAQDAETQKIINTIQDELKAFSNKDKAKWETFWVHTDKARRTSVGSGFYEEYIGWDSLSNSTKAYFNSTGEGYKGTKSNFDISIKKDMAVAHYIEKSGVFSANATVILERQNKDWKFVEMHALYKSTFSDADENIEGNINTQGYLLLAKNKTNEALKVFQLNTELFPLAYNTWDSLAEAYKKSGDNQKAIEYYQKSLDLNPKNENAKKILAELKK